MNLIVSGRGVVPGGAGGAMAPPDFGRSVMGVKSEEQEVFANFSWYRSYVTTKKLKVRVKKNEARPGKMSMTT